MRRRAFVAGAAVLLARPSAAAAQGGDGAVLRDLIAREDAAAAAHLAADTGFSRHEADHAAALRTHLAALGLDAPGAIDLDGPARRLAAERTTAAAVALEEALLRRYGRALTRLREPSILRTAATVLASHAQHRALLRRP